MAADAGPRTGGGSQRAAAPGQWPLLVALAVAVGGLAYALLVAWRPGAAMVGVALGLAALFRLLLPDRVAGLLQVRSRAFDVAALAMLAIGIVVSAVVVPDAPGG